MGANLVEGSFGGARSTLVDLTIFVLVLQLYIISSQQGGITFDPQSHFMLKRKIRDHLNSS